MDTATGQPAITIRQRSSAAGGTKLELIAYALDVPALTIELLDRDIIRERCSRFAEDIAHGIKAWREADSQDYAALRQIIGSIAIAGKIFLGNTLKDPGQAYPSLRRFFNVACPMWSPQSRQVPLVHVVAEPEEYYPWELLPLFADREALSADDQLSLEQSCRKLLGFNAVVERRHSTWSEGDLYLSTWDSKIPMRFVYDAQYEGAIEELAFFLSRSYVHLEGPYPRCVSDQSAPSLARQLAYPHISIDGTLREFADEIVHISCHCHAEPGASSRTFALHLSDEDQGRMIVSLDELTGEMVDHWEERLEAEIRRRGGDGRRRDMPLVFLNACGTAVMDPAVASSFVKLFCDNDNRCIIATTANVPDDIASRMSRYFYDVLSTGVDVGTSLHQAKWRLLMHDRNPMGIVYCVHAFAGLQMLPVLD